MQDETESLDTIKGSSATMEIDAKTSAVEKPGRKIGRIACPFVSPVPAPIGHGLALNRLC